jgi:hypothetical protein
MTLCPQAEDGGNSLQKWQVAVSMQDIWMIGIKKKNQTAKSVHYTDVQFALLQRKILNFFSDYKLPK